MTANTSVAPSVAVPVPARPVAPAESRESSEAAAHFGRQLDAARQRGTGTAEAHEPSKAASRFEPQRDAAQRQPDQQGTTDVTNASIVQAAAVIPPSQAGVVPEGAISPQAEHGDGVDDQAASAMAGAMLALLGPSMAIALRPGAVAAGASAGPAVHGGAGKGGATDASASALLQVSGTGDLAAAVSALPVNASALAAPGDAVLPHAEAAKDSLSGLAQAVALPTPLATAAPAGVHLLQLPSPVGSQSFTQELGQQVAWLGGQDIKQARIRLHPDELGQLDLKVSVTQGRVDVVFNAQHPAAVTALQQSLSQLGHMLAQHGLTLGHAEVGQHDRGNHHDHGRGTPNAIAVDDVGEVHGVALPVSLGTVSLLDAFA